MGANHFLRIELDAGVMDKTGTSVVVHSSTKAQLLISGAVHGFQSSMENTLHFGLGRDSLVAKIVVNWPDGSVQTLYNPVVDRTLIVKYEQSAPLHFAPTETSHLFENVSEAIDVDYVHRENKFNDFKIDPMLPWQYSKSGPGMSVGDVNGDGLDDFFIGGASGFAGEVFLQTDFETFSSVTLTDQAFEDTGALLFDADNDADMDLYVVSGGSEFSNPLAYQDRLYINDGEGNFSRSKTALPRIVGSGTCVRSADFDRDGDLDLFVGGGIHPGSYPQHSPSYLLSNHQGVFSDITQRNNPKLGDAGLVRDALWADINGDDWPDLLVVGEWMPIMVFLNHEGKLEEVSATWKTDNLTGFWNSIAQGDFDMDGDIDFIIGNLGLNTKYKASNEHPVSVYYHDFDRNGKVDAIITTSEKDQFGTTREYPLAGYDEVVRQIKGLEKKFPMYGDFAMADIQAILSKEQLEKAKIKRVNLLQSIYLENASGSFIARPLPIHAQLGPVRDILIDDVDGDLIPDALLLGTLKTTPSTEAWYDALTGVLLLGDGSANFKTVSSDISGLWARHASMVSPILIGDSPHLIAVQNGGKPLFFKMKSPISNSKKHEKQ
ncbi:MAG: hypothetical protein HC819_03830 [Cyclobacteriaceae bacterium]|nr:hypothetical protein [Cyclobacteriaceae bacterium]